MSLNNQFMEDSMKTPDKKEMIDLEGLITKHLELENEIDILNEATSEKKAELRRLSEEAIPNMFQTIGIQEFKLTDGSSVSVKPYYAANISAAKHDECFAWLRDHGLDDVIKHNIIIDFGRGEDEDCNQLKDLLMEANVNYTEKSGVHPQTLKALVREQMENMSERLDTKDKFPAELFSVFIGNKTKIKKPKGGK